MKLTKIDPSVVEDKLANQGVRWKFITERASHRGGQWERVCRQLKEPLRKVLGRAFLTYTEMMTVLTDIEATINSHPLTYIGDDVRDGRIITPALLAIGRDLGSPPDNPPKKAEVSLSERYRYQQRLQDHFWSRWVQEYLPGLTVRQKWTREEIPLKENDVVLNSKDNIPRGKWRVGRVMETFPGKDGRIRTVRLQTKKGSINRPVQKLHLLEEHRDTNEVQRNEQFEKVQNDKQFPEVHRVGNDCSPFGGGRMYKPASKSRVQGGKLNLPRDFCTNLIRFKNRRETTVTSIRVKKKYSLNKTLCFPFVVKMGLYTNNTIKDEALRIKVQFFMANAKSEVKR